MAGRCATRERDPGDQLGPNRDDERRIEVVRGEDGGGAIGPMKLRACPTGQPVDDPPSDVSQVGGTLAEVLVIDGCQRVCLGRRDPIDRLLRGRALIDRRHRRVDDPGIGREQRLRPEDGADVLAGTRRSLCGKGRQLGGRRVQGRAKALTLGTGVATRGGRCGNGRCRFDPQQQSHANARRTGAPDERRPRHARRSGRRGRRAGSVARGSRVGEDREQQRRRRRSGVLVPDAPLAEV